MEVVLYDWIKPVFDVALGSIFPIALLVYGQVAMVRDLVAMSIGLGWGSSLNGRMTSM